MFRRIEKFAINASHLAIIWLIFRTLCGEVSWGITGGFIAVSALWLGLTSLHFRYLLITYFDRMSRVQFLAPLVTSVSLSTIAALFTSSPALRLVALGEIIIWAILYVLYDRNRKKFIVLGYGPLPSDIWVNAPWEALEPGDVVLTGGRMAARTRNSVGHMELALRQAGAMVAFSSYMESGIVIHKLRAVLKVEAKSKGHYVVMRPRQGFSPEQNTAAVALTLDMEARNKQWFERELKRRTDLINRWLPDSRCNAPGLGRLIKPLKAWLVKKYLPTGYDWKGLYTGLASQDRWTCMGACLQVLDKVGVPTLHYGTGLLGLGTGLLNPLLPVRFLYEPNFRHLTTEDKRLWEETHSAPGPKASPAVVAGADSEPAQSSPPLPALEGGVSAPASQALTQSASAVQARSADQILADFKTEWIKPSSGILDAWLVKREEDFLVFHVENIENPLPAVPSVYQGLTTIISLFPRQA